MTTTLAQKKRTQKIRGTVAWKVLGVVRNVLLVWTALSAIAPFVGVDRFPWGLFFVYPPRLVYFFAAVAIAVPFFFRWNRWRAGIAAVVAAVCLFHTGWGGGASRIPEEHVALVSLDLAGAGQLSETSSATQLERLRTFCREVGADVVCLQNVPGRNRAELERRLADFRFVWARPADSRFGWQRSSLVGIRKSWRFAEKKVARDIAGVGTFAALVDAGESSFWVVDVHATAPWSISGEADGFFASIHASAKRHIIERDSLNRWFQAHEDRPVVVGGNFYAPYYARAASFDGMTNAHRQAGLAFHLTAPRRLSFWGVDHVLGSDEIEFFLYETHDLGFGPHEAQLALFRTRE